MPPPPRPRVRLAPRPAPCPRGGLASSGQAALYMGVGVRPPPLPLVYHAPPPGSLSAQGPGIVRAGGAIYGGKGQTSPTTAGIPCPPPPKSRAPGATRVAAGGGPPTRGGGGGGAWYTSGSGGGLTPTPIYSAACPAPLSLKRGLWYPRNQTGGNYADSVP
jgi:hypothetical protein